MSFKNEDIPFTLVSRNKPTSSPQMTSSRDINPDKFKSVIGHLVYKKWIEKNEDGTWCVLVPKDEKIYRNINDALDVCLSKGSLIAMENGNVRTPYNGWCDNCNGPADKFPHRTQKDGKCVSCKEKQNYTSQKIVKQTFDSTKDFDSTKNFPNLPNHKKKENKEKQESSNEWFSMKNSLNESINANSTQEFPGLPNHKETSGKLSSSEVVKTSSDETIVPKEETIVPNDEVTVSSIVPNDEVTVSIEETIVPNDEVTVSIEETIVPNDEVTVSKEEAIVEITENKAEDSETIATLPICISDLPPLSDGWAYSPVNTPNGCKLVVLQVY